GIDDTRRRSFRPPEEFPALGVQTGDQPAVVDHVEKLSVAYGRGNVGTAAIVPLPGNVTPRHVARAPGTQGKDGPAAGGRIDHAVGNDGRGDDPEVPVSVGVQSPGSPDLLAGLGIVAGNVVAAADDDFGLAAEGE